LNFQENYFQDPTKVSDLYTVKCVIVQAKSTSFVQTNSLFTAKTAYTIRFSEAVPEEDGKGEDEHMRWGAQILFGTQLK